MDKVCAKSDEVRITIPEIVSWDDIQGFSYTRSKASISPIIDSSEYLNSFTPNKCGISTLKNDHVFVHYTNNETFAYSAYKCIYFEHVESNKTYIIFSGVWYEVDNGFMFRINALLNNVNVSAIKFPEVYTWSESIEGKVKEKIESEGAYNARVAMSPDYYLLDKVPMKSNRTTTAIELCDLMTLKGQYIHVKHRKGNSAGLSHLFAQGTVSAEVLLGDKEFRKEVRSKLRKIDTGLANTVPLNKVDAKSIEVVFLILGEDSKTIKNNLPFFSKVNLTKAHESLTQKGFNVSIAGAGKVAMPKA